MKGTIARSKKKQAPHSIQMRAHKNLKMLKTLFVISQTEEIYYRFVLVCIFFRPLTHGPEFNNHATIEDKD